jgi:hypothetical protein
LLFFFYFFFIAFFVNIFSCSFFIILEEVGIIFEKSTTTQDVVPFTAGLFGFFFHLFL